MTILFNILGVLFYGGSLIHLCLQYREIMKRSKE
jgi:hypothetical protein